MDKLMQRVKSRLSKGGPAPKRGRSRLLVDSANECAAQDANRKRSAGDTLDLAQFPRNTRRHVATADEQRDTHSADQCATGHTSGAQRTITTATTDGGFPGDALLDNGGAQLGNCVTFGRGAQLDDGAAAVDSSGGPFEVTRMPKRACADKDGGTTCKRMRLGGQAKSDAISDSANGTATLWNNGDVSPAPKRPTTGGSVPVCKRARNRGSSTPQHDGANRASSTAITPDGSA